jgi:hypothetical protein
MAFELFHEKHGIFSTPIGLERSWSVPPVVYLALI